MRPRQSFRGKCNSFISPEAGSNQMCGLQAGADAQLPGWASACRASMRRLYAAQS